LNQSASVFNKTYQLRAVRQGGGGHQLAAKAILRLPEPWRPLVTVAAAAEEAFYRPERRVRPGRAKSSHRQSVVSTQLELFPDKAARNFIPLSKIDGPGKFYARDPERPLFDLFPEAYV
jgi:hypothetical protein